MNETTTSTYSGPCEWCTKRYPTAEREAGVFHLLPGGVDVPCYDAPASTDGAA